MNKKGFEFAPALFFSLLIVIFILAPVLLKVISSTTTNLFSAVNSTSAEAVTEGQASVNLFTGLFDYLIITFLVVNLLILFISAFYIDTHAVFLILYILSAFIFMLFAPNLLYAVEIIWGVFATETASLPYTSFLQSHAIGFTLSIIFLTGIIIYAKFKLTQDGF